MLTLYSYPELFGVTDNNGYGLKVYAFLKLAGVPFRHEHVFDASAAPRGQLPYIIEDGETIGDSETIIAHLTEKHALTIDAALSSAQRRSNHLVTRMLDDLYWVMSYSRWKDDRFYPAFRDAFMAQHSRIDAAGLDKAREYNAQRYYYQGIGRYTPDQAYERGIADLKVLAELVPEKGFVHGPAPTSIDAGIYGFIANIHFFPIPTPLKAFVDAHPNLERHCEAIHEAVGNRGGPPSTTRRSTMPIQHFPPPSTIKAPPLSFAARVGDLLFVSGTPGFDEKGALPETFEAQFGNVVRNIKRVLDEAGASLHNLVKVNVLLTRASDVAAMNALYAGAFGPPPYPARTTCVVHALPDPKMLIEIECVASLAE